MVTQLHVGLKGTMNALFLKDLADKTRRGLRGRVEQGKSGGGNSYGYTVVKQFGGDGEAVHGDRAVNPEEAAVVTRILQDYAAGKSAKRIASELNREGIRAPSGGDWGFSTINGNPKRGTGILNNELYVGKLVWNRQRFVKDPVTGKRQARLNESDAWLSREVPHLRIVDNALWAAVTERKRMQRVTRPDGASGDVTRINERRRARYLLSGLTRCGQCGGGYAMISVDILGCSTARNKGTCANRRNIRRDELERRVLTALHSHLMDPALFAAFCDEFTRELNRIRMEGGAAITAARAEIDKLERDIDATVEMMIRLGPGPSTDRLNGKMVRLEARQKTLKDFVAVAKEPPALLHPEMAVYYRQQVAALHELLQHGPETGRMKASEILRSLVSAIVLAPADKGLAIDVKRDLAGILAVATNAKNPGAFASGGSQLKMVAGTGPFSIDAWHYPLEENRYLL